MSYKVIGYAMNPSLSGITEEDVHKLTGINLAFGLIKDGLLDMRILPDIHLIEKYRAWNPDLKIVLSIGGWEAGGFSEMAMTAEGRKAFAQSCLEAVNKYNLDGIDIDWEYPCSDAAGIACSPLDRENFTLLLQALRDAIGDNKILSIAAGAGEYYIRNTEMDKVAQILDYVQLMTYDLNAGFNNLSSHHAALYSSYEGSACASTAETVELFHNAGVPYEKMIIGAAFYARHFEVSAFENNGLYQPAGIGEAGPTFSEITPEYLEANGYKEFWDDKAQAAYLWNGKTFVSYENEKAVRLKCDYMKQKGLLGIMYWEHGNDKKRVLLTAMHDEINK